MDPALFFLTRAQGRKCSSPRRLLCGNSCLARMPHPSPIYSNKLISIPDQHCLLAEAFLTPHYPPAAARACLL